MMHSSIPGTPAPRPVASESPVPVTKVTLSTTKGPISALIVAPARADAPTLFALHGISRTSGDVFEAFASQAVATGHGLVVPHFDRRTWPVFQRISKCHRPDFALLALMEALDLKTIAAFGYSGGAQLAHRFAMLYPNRVTDLALGAPGWVTLPDTDIPYPMGVKGPGHAAVMRRNLDHFRAIPVTIWCGSADTVRDRSLRTSPALDVVQGPTRLARAEAYHAALLKQGMSACLHRIPDVGHDFTACAKAGRIAQAVMST